MKQKIIYWLLNYPESAYDSMKRELWMHRPQKIWDTIRVALASWLMGKIEYKEEQ
jgi:hypothetical protein